MDYFSSICPNDLIANFDDSGHKKAAITSEYGNEEPKYMDFSSTQFSSSRSSFSDSSALSSPSSSPNVLNESPNMTTTLTNGMNLLMPNDSSLFHSNGAEFYSAQIRSSNNNVLFVTNTSKSEKTNGDFCMPLTKSTIKQKNDNIFNQLGAKQLSVVYTNQI